MKLVDFRSDTASPISDRMRDAMVNAVIGDDVLGEDPNVQRLEALSAQLFQKEAAVIVASGTMGNQIALMTLASPGDEVVVYDSSHIYNLEGGGLAALAGAQVRPVQAPPRSGLDLNVLEHAIRPGGIQSPRTRVLCLENTLDLNRGIPVTPEDQQAVSDLAHQHGAKVYLDGARVFNAAVALDRPLSDFGASVDCLQFCLNKGLSSAVGAVLVGDREFIDRARYIRQRIGGAVRHIGYMAAAGVVALQELTPRIALDHQHATRLRDGLRAISGRLVGTDESFTNIIRLDAGAMGLQAVQVVDGFRKFGILVKNVDPTTCRMVTHSGTTADDVEAALDAAQAVFASIGGRG